MENLSAGVVMPGCGPLPILRNVSFRVLPGETLGLVGESGSGKSTLALTMMGYLSEGLVKLGGDVHFGGHSMFEAGTGTLQALRGGEICLIPQNAGQSLTPTMTIGQQIDEALMLHTDLSPRERKRQVVELLEQVRMPEPAVIARRHPHALSGGQQQRCAVAMALAGRPRVLLLDEPTTGLDVTTQVHILELLRELAKSRQVAMVFVSHDLGAVARVSDRIAVLYSGELVEIGPSTRILKSPEHPYTRGLLASIPRMDGARVPEVLPGYPPPLAGPRERCAFAPRCSAAKDPCTAGRPALDVRGERYRVRCHFRRDELDDPGSLVRPSTRPRNGVPASSLLEVRNVAITYSRKSLLSRFTGKEDPARVLTVDDVSFTVHRGETIGVVGESGSGKSTILRAIVGLQPPCRGDIRMEGSRPLDDRVDTRPLACKKEIQLVFQNPDSSLNPRKTVAEIISAPLELYFGMERGPARERAAQLLQSVRLTEHYLDRTPGQLSGGEKQRVGIARAFAAEPKLALCDEVTSALDVSVQAAVLDLLSNLQREMGVAYLFVSHDLATVRSVADRVLVLYQGRICETGPVESVFAPPFHPYTGALMGAILEPDPDRRPRVEIKDTVESAPPRQGCPFQRRCPHKPGKICDREAPPAQELANGHRIYCHLSPAILHS
ncbi:MAG: ABC transporter ATP-binding protein [Gammaproteobacteria bacterium]|nr:ABC transporter ATP-binding protein [Gammaproteobacteria bacterium]